jgi:hypothetical protein
MPLPDDIRELAEGILGRLDESRDYYEHTEEAWRVVQQVAAEGRCVGIRNAATGQDISASELKPMAQRYVSVRLTHSVFKGLSADLEDWVLVLARLWLTAYPVQLDAAYNESVERYRSQRREEIQVPCLRSWPPPIAPRFSKAWSNGWSANWRTADHSSGSDSWTTGSI